MIGSNTTIDIRGKKVRGRQYPWGIVESMFMIILYEPKAGEKSFIVIQPSPLDSVLSHFLRLDCILKNSGF